MTSAGTDHRRRAHWPPVNGRPGPPSVCRRPASEPRARRGTQAPRSTGEAPERDRVPPAPQEHHPQRDGGPQRPAQIAGRQCSATPSDRSARDRAAVEQEDRRRGCLAAGPTPARRRRPPAAEAPRTPPLPGRPCRPRPPGSPGALRSARPRAPPPPGRPRTRPGAAPSPSRRAPARSERPASASERTGPGAWR